MRIDCQKNVRRFTMPEVISDSLAERVAEIERRLAIGSDPRPTDWRGIVGMFPDDEFTRAWIADVEAARKVDD